MQTSDIMRMDTPTARLRAVTFLEGLSFLVLLLVAMPLKYMAEIHQPVRVVGMLHGLLFVTLGLLVLQAMRTRGKRFAWAVRIGLASLVPFGTFFLDRQLRADDAAYRRATPPDRR